MVETVLAHIPCKSGVRLLELGTGSGAIAIALAKECPDFEIIATDISEKALNLARENAKNLRITSIQWLQGDWFDALSKLDLNNRKFNAIVSNPPYIDPQDKHLKEGDLRFEPITALVSKESGLKDIRQIIHSAPLYMEEGAMLFLEHGYNQHQQVQEIFKEMKQYSSIKSVQDLTNIMRLTLGQFSNKPSNQHSKT